MDANQMLKENRIRFLNAFYDNLSLGEVLAAIQNHVDSRNPGFMVSLNTQIAVDLEKNSLFAESFSNASIALMDSQPLVWLARSEGLEVKEKLCGSDIIYPVCELAASKGFSCYFLGGAPGVPDKAAENLKTLYPELVVAGTFSPSIGFMDDVDALTEIGQLVTDAQPDIVFVCLGVPRQEILTNFLLKECGVPFCLCIGAAVDFAAGNMTRAPRWMSDHGLEWLYRFFHEPKRLFKRYFIESWDILKIYKRTHRREEN